MTPAMKCFLFLLKRSSEACGDHRRHCQAAGTYSVLGDAATKKMTYINRAVAGTGEKPDSEMLLFTAVKATGRNMFTL